MQRVRIGTCHGPTDASLVRSMLAAHDIQSVVNGEQHASLLGGLGGGFIQMDIWVAADDAEQASALLRELRAGDHAALEDDGEPDELDDEPAFAQEIEQRRHLGVVLLLAFCVTFGTAHMYLGVWALGVLLAFIEIAALTQLGDSPELGVSLLLGTIAFDALGAIRRVRRLGRVELPRARAR